MIPQAHRFLARLHRGAVSAAQIADAVAAYRNADPADHDAGAHLPLHVYLGLTFDEYGRYLSDGTLPTEAQHHEVPCDDRVAVREPDGAVWLLSTHGPIRCAPPCPVHDPSDHPLKAADRCWDAPRAILRRWCPCGVTHPDPDDRTVRRRPLLAAHDCCPRRCCGYPE